MVRLDAEDVLYVPTALSSPRLALQQVLQVTRDDDARLSGLMKEKVKIRQREQSHLNTV